MREGRSSGWPTRVVDHETESGVNAAAASADKIHHDSLDPLVIQKFMTAGVTASMWKRDISKAFRLANHHDLDWTVWQAEGKFGSPNPLACHLEQSQESMHRTGWVA